MKTITLTDLKNHCRNLDPIQCDFYAHGAIVALENHQHTSGVKITLEGICQETICLYWDSSPIKNGWREKRDSTECGAITMAFFLVTSFTEYEVVEQSQIGSGFDYYLGYKEGNVHFDANNFLQAKLEISGIHKGNANEIAARIRIKLKQTDVSDSVPLPVYVSVTEFSQPISVLHKK